MFIDGNTVHMILQVTTVKKITCIVYAVHSQIFLKIDKPPAETVISTESQTGQRRRANEEVNVEPGTPQQHKQATI
jgi:hypothetical protein